MPCERNGEGRRAYSASPGTAAHEFPPRFLCQFYSTLCEHSPSQSRRPLWGKPPLVISPTAFPAGSRSRAMTRGGAAFEFQSNPDARRSPKAPQNTSAPRKPPSKRRRFPIEKTAPPPPATLFRPCPDRKGEGPLRVAACRAPRGRWASTSALKDLPAKLLAVSLDRDFETVFSVYPSADPDGARYPPVMKPSASTPGTIRESTAAACGPCSAMSTRFGSGWSLMLDGNHSAM